ncbi:adenosylcobinamide-phosphate synthase [Nocardioides scoriae]|uniref:Cobalamin biosynthesis protein CobD n=1 Tax=Nocardioides scoriae TaxID=642780 RepID=A0A1H1P1E7_9ACTN|nr:cobalamin biosynthesis protein [Nocardioides scoriae]SDS05022.1 adenosylcobinamide-phosphate synthase [Nocardioides scoriae]
MSTRRARGVRGAVPTRALGLGLGFLADRLLGDPQRFHPVAGFGRVAGALEQRTWAPSRRRGAAYALVLVGGTTGLGALAERSTRGRPVAHVVVTAVATWSVLGGTSLDREGRAVAALLDADRLPEARQRLTHLVGRDTTALTSDEVARAVVESVAENTSDAVVAPLVLGAVAGVPGLVGYRAANTLDAMVGHRSERHVAFGWASARLDDLLNLPGSRLSALLAAACGPDPRGALRAWRRDAGGHPSPNAGPVEASFAGALGLRLGGTNTYGDRVEHRPVMGSGRALAAADVSPALALARRVDLAAAVLAAAWALARRRPAGARHDR